MRPEEIERSVVALAKYQTRLELLLKPNSGQNEDGKLSNKFMNYLRRHGPNGEWLSEHKMLNNTNAFDYGIRCDKVLISLAYNGEIERSNTAPSANGKAARVVRLVIHEDPTE